MRNLTTISYLDVSIDAIKAGDFSDPKGPGAFVDDYEMVSACDDFGTVKSIKVINYYGTWSAIGVDDFGVGSEHIVFQWDYDPSIKVRIFCLYPSI